ncbi:MAG: DUF1667 domain-containing protein [Candidatus Bathyarchaeota archaeon]|nr:MAG: DUF1667 domain-containing protein [Candidatus Bathyarchaeota archaeon]
MNREITCIICPIGCRATVVLRGENIVSINNLECPRGKPYIINEIKAPVRDFFSIVKIEGASIPVLPIRTTGPIPKEKMLDCMVELAKIVVKAPIKIGNIIVENFCNLGVDVISTKDLDAIQ